MYKRRTLEDLSYKETVNKIVELNNHINSFWSSAYGWAPIEAANLLSKSRLDWLSSLSHSLYKWEKKSIVDAEQGDLILAWCNLGALVEGTLKFFLSVYYENYTSDINIIVKRKKEIDPDGAMLNDLREFFKKSVWTNDEREEKNNWLELIQNRRNAIHAYKDREIDNFDFFRLQVKNYLGFLMDLLGRVPYPDVNYGPDFYL
jgi:hypothetical protein